MMASAQRDAWPMLFGAFVTALIASLAVLFVGEVMGQVPCDLCWFQHAFMFPLAVLLGLAALRSDASIAPYGITLAAIGAVTAGFHSLLYVGVIPEAKRAKAECSTAVRSIRTRRPC